MGNNRIYIGPPVELVVYRNDIVVRHLGNGRGGIQNAARRECYEWSWKSRRSLAFVASNTNIEFDVMVTLTYPRSYPGDGKTCKRHLNAFLQFMRRRIKGLSYLWFFEFQRRGAPHFHILYKSMGVMVPKEDLSVRWYSIVDSGDDRHLKAGTRVEKIRSKDGARRYAVKYAQKMEQKAVPKGFRSVGAFWNCSRDVRPRTLGTVTLEGGSNQLERMLEDWPHMSNAASGYSVLYNATEFLTLG